MQAKNESLENSLRCLQHPLTVLSIVVLVLNDHVFKIITPSWLTGKLSDFAGLFFFPFIVALGLSLFLNESNLTSHQLGQIAFWLVAIWFILLKTASPFNALTAQFSSFLVGSPVHFIMDWTDIIGLTVMFPAWKIWKQRQRWQRNAFAYIALSIGVLAAIATSPREWTVYTVTNLEFHDGIVYAADRDGWGESSYPVAESTDIGTTWQLANNISNIEERSLPIKLCSHLTPDICFQVAKDGTLDESNNNGNNWTRIITEAHDLILFDWKSKEYVIAAIGERGILRRELPNGNWEKISVFYANK